MKVIISIITVCYNSGDVLEKTIKSIAEQSYQGIEYLIVDGQSKDNTLSIIQQNEPHISQWISEPDKGLYDAMNKGLQMATGDFVWFVNAGDILPSPSIVEEMMKSYTPDTDILYGDVMMVDDDWKDVGLRSEITPHQLPDNLNWQSLCRGMVVSHQAFLPSRSIAPLYMEGNLSADIDWVIECLKKAKKVTHTHLVLARFQLGGTSRQHHQQSLKDRFTVLQKHYGVIPNWWNHGVILVRAAWFRIIRWGKPTY